MNWNKAYTPKTLTIEMLQNDDHFTTALNTFLDPSCGNGDLLINIIAKKLSLGFEIDQVLKTTYGIDLDFDKIQNCQNLVKTFIESKCENDEFKEYCFKIIENNIRHGNIMEEELDEIFTPIYTLNVENAARVMSTMVQDICTNLNLNFNFFDETTNYKNIEPVCYGVFSGNDTIAYLGRSNNNLARIRSLYGITSTAHNKSIYVANFRKAHADTTFGYFTSKTGDDAQTVEALINQYLSKEYGKLKFSGFSPIYKGKRISNRNMMKICNDINGFQGDLANFCIEFRNSGDCVYQMKKFVPFGLKTLYNDLNQAFGRTLRFKDD